MANCLSQPAEPIIKKVLETKKFNDIELPYFKDIKESWREAFRVKKGEPLWIYFLPYTPNNKEENKEE